MDARHAAQSSQNERKTSLMLQKGHFGARTPSCDAIAAEGEGLCQIAMKREREMREGRGGGVINGTEPSTGRAARAAMC